MLPMRANFDIGIKKRKKIGAVIKCIEKFPKKVKAKKFYAQFCQKFKITALYWGVDREIKYFITCGEAKCPLPSLWPCHGRMNYKDTALLTPLSSRVCNLELAQTSYPS
jgi:hypothetical protein